MSDLRDAFKKAGLINEKEEKRLKHEERVRKKKLGRDGVEAEKQQQQKESTERKQRDKQKVKKAQKAHDQSQEQRAHEKSVMARLKEEKVRQVQGPRRFHYRDADGFLPFLNLADDAVRRLEGGEYGLVQLPDSAEVVVVKRDLAEDVRATRGELLRHLKK